MEIIWFDEIDSTQNYLVKQIKSGSLHAPVCVASHTQTNGIGSRSNRWEQQGEALLFSFAMPIVLLPDDLKIESASVYFMYIFKDLLASKGSQCWFKWPNDIYIGDNKVAGAITSFLNAAKTLVCGIGINISGSKKYGNCDIRVDKKELLLEYLSMFRTPPSWQQIFIKLEVEFENKKEKMLQFANFGLDSKVALNFDGSLTVNNEKVYSLR